MQIRDASIRYSHEIAELRDFLSQAGLALDSEETLHRITLRLRVDRTFSRDLTSHLWVILHAGERQVRHSDLLAIVAIAAAGLHFAADAGDAEAHELLRFVLQASSSFAKAPATMADARPRMPYEPATLPPVRSLASTHQIASAQQIAPGSFLRRVEEDHEAPLSLTMPEDDNSRTRLVGLGVAACVSLVVLLVLLLHHSSPTSAVGPAASVPAPVEKTTPMPMSTNRDAAAPIVRQPIKPTVPNARATSRSAPYSALAESANELPPAGGAPHAKPAPGTPMTSASRAVASNRLHPSSSARTTSLARTTRPATDASSRVPTVVPVDTLGLRGNMTSAGTTRQAIVRPTSLGIMAANVTYSPAPAYPAAASAARVQGEVKLEAEVGRDGTVASTRIISGPPLLADAAANAVQQWRYRPYLYGGKPIAMNAQIVMDFQLP